MLANRQTDRQTDAVITILRSSYRLNETRSGLCVVERLTRNPGSPISPTIPGVPCGPCGPAGPSFPRFPRRPFSPFIQTSHPAPTSPLSPFCPHKHNCSRRAAHLQTDAGHYFQLLSATSILDATLLLHESSRAFTDECIRYDTRDATLTCARKPTRVSLIYRTEPTTKKCKTEKLKSKNGYPQK